MFGKKSSLSSIGQLIVECSDDAIRIVSGGHRINSIIEEVGFVSVQDSITGATILVSKDDKGNLIKADGDYWPSESDDRESNDPEDDNYDPAAFRNDPDLIKR